MSKKKGFKKNQKQIEQTTWSVSEEELLSRGYMTTEEFVDRFSLTLLDHLRSAFPQEDALHHPEDLFIQTWNFAEIAARIQVHF